MQFCFKQVWTIPLFCAIIFHEVIESFLEDLFVVKLFYQISITFSIPFLIFSLTSIVTLQWLFELAPQYIDASKASCLDEAKKYDMLSVKVSGQELLEAYANGGTEGIQEERT